MLAAGVLVAPVAHDSRIVALTFEPCLLVEDRYHTDFCLFVCSRDRVGPDPGLGPGPGRSENNHRGAISGRRGRSRGPLGPGCDFEPALAFTHQRRSLKIPITDFLRSGGFVTSLRCWWHGVAPQPQAPHSALAPFYRRRTLPPWLSRTSCLLLGHIPPSPLRF